MSRTEAGPQGAERLFRRKALERLTTTEDFDQPPTLVSPRGLRLQLALAILCILAAVMVLVVGA
ncbi:hypothetical protein M5E06_22605 [Azospirillum sp. A1-3]|uniref:hypothetical protein n=1 Tax=Azospirillum sp. A1-3 TaxID=185874 RepID=UPI002076F8DE|nr:hypothetical protein [Azospirillum sp. A1-3]MCM8736914.1 hypothetical protein [Azospirillum sp. A1-3]